ncbi:transport permease protein [Planotetraspora thailandica]|uniref:Transport permease protein n=1 Tax=Planotetraspora thailandica TaxID=487172 RepID=A0A8J3XV44_9ACTN|nr:ABC transporter permease [Planotetraspora thailandica]GII56137.1 transport permease protein [Planotetraspora thailandica]
MNTLALGIRRGLIEQGSILRDGKELGANVAGLVIYLMLILWIGGNPAGGGIGMTAFITVGFIAFTVFSAGITTLPMLIAADQEEGALRRLRTLPRGLPVYLTGRATSLVAHIALNSVLILAIGNLAGGLALPSSLYGWATLTWVLLLGTLAVVPVGAMIGALLPSAKTAAAVVSLPTMLLMIASGVMVPMTMMPEPVRWFAQVFPLYWQGHGLRAAFLPSAAAEPGGVWQLGTAAAVMGAWAVAGMVLAPRLLRRAIRT